MRRLICIMFAVGLGFIVSRWLVVEGNPEHSFWRSCMDRKVEEVVILRDRSPKTPVVLFAGGSTCAFSVSPDVFEQQTGMPAYNMGGAVPMGVPYLASKVFEVAEKGDVVVLLLEPVFLTTNGEAEPKRLGVSMSSTESSSDIKTRFGSDLNIETKLKHLRPGSNFLFTLMGKKLLKKKGYRYSMEDFRDRGRLETFYENPLKRPQATVSKLALTDSGIKLLKSFREIAKEKDITVVYGLPWTWTKEDIKDDSKAANEVLLREIEKYIPVLREPSMGVSTSEGYFSDSVNHLTYEGASVRTKEVADALKRFMSSRR